MSLKTKAKLVKALPRTSADIAAALEKRFPANAYAVIYEVGNGTGGNVSRHCDALVQSLWPSRGLSLSGFEFKVSRTDWVRERDNPAKSDSILRYCDYWWLIVSDESIVHPGELPETWGLMALKGDTLRAIKEAPKLSPVPMDRSMLAAICRRVSEPVANLAKQETERIRRDAFEHGRLVGDRNSQDRENRLEKLETAIREFQDASGINFHDSIHRWRHDSPTATKLGEAVKFVLSGGMKTQVRTLQGFRSCLAELLAAADAAITTGERLAAPPQDAAPAAPQLDEEQAEQLVG